MCFLCAGSGLHFPNGTGTSEQYPAAFCCPRRLPRYRGGLNERTKLLQEVLLKFLQVSQPDRPVARLIDDATETVNQPYLCLACTFDPTTVGTPGTSARIVCAGTSARTAVPSCHGPWGRACLGNFARRRIDCLHSPHITRHRYWRTEPRGGMQKESRRRDMIWSRVVTAGSTGERKIGMTT